MNRTQSVAGECIRSHSMAKLSRSTSIRLGRLTKCSSGRAFVRAEIFARKARRFGVRRQWLQECGRVLAHGDRILLRAVVGLVPVRDQANDLAADLRFGAGARLGVMGGYRKNGLRPNSFSEP